MVRVCLCAVTAWLLAAGSLLAADAKDQKDRTGKKGDKATITKVDRQKGTVTVRMKDKNGKDVERTFKLTGEVR